MVWYTYVTDMMKTNFTHVHDGTSLIWYDFYDSVTFPFAEALATYSIDGSIPIPFNLNGI